MWLCQCKCGTIRSVKDSSLRSGRSKSCGCFSREVRSDATIDLKGMIFGRLTVLHRANVKKGSNVHWVCQCECGKIKTVSGDSLRRGLTKSCGCLQKEISTQTGRNSFVDLRGKRFGKLIVLSDTGRRHGKNIIWHCRCDCGNYTDVPGADCSLAIRVVVDIVT
ncbi:MAG: hypothetical protein GX428_11335 [Candidatus Atribacteria bacterium]|nr:hypothetical protein [Candidatus Atribacteria bacterium]